MRLPSLLVHDALGYLQENPGQFHVIISDTTDPIGMADPLFSDEFSDPHACAPLFLATPRPPPAEPAILLIPGLIKLYICVLLGTHPESCVSSYQYYHLLRRSIRMLARFRYSLAQPIKIFLSTLSEYLHQSRTSHNATVRLCSVFIEEDVWITSLARSESDLCLQPRLSQPDSLHCLPLHCFPQSCYALRDQLRSAFLITRRNSSQYC